MSQGRVCRRGGFVVGRVCRGEGLSQGRICRRGGFVVGWVCRREGLSGVGLSRGGFVWGEFVGVPDLLHGLLV